MDVPRHEERCQRLVAALRKLRLDALLVSHEPNVRYLTGFTGDSTQLLIGPNVAILISDSRFETQLSQECPGVETAIRTARTPMADFLAQIVESRHLAQVGIEASHITVDQFLGLKSRLSSTELVPAEPLVSRLRAVKDKLEVAAIRRAIAMAERGFQAASRFALPSNTERQFAHELEHLMRRHGALKAAFEPIVGTGPQSALPHYRAGKSPLEASPFTLVDWGAVEPGGYHSDLTRMVSTSKIPPKLEKLYRVVLNARAAALEQIRPGVAGKDVDAAARKVIADAGFDRYFGHGLGHGIGLEIHEAPRLSPTAEELLQPGMVVTVEPGVYLPGFGGVRLEDDVLITREGYTLLSTLPLEIESLV